ncbi:hypothetical protein NM688_g7428 [Phlebia brevispora]|uniref:Uncharacterized protein n=1 Tax=Phlebia brevispora TaxID=194682 RepID=A0ACC1S596_9APHY|nr:hypothetical protein NM688_g7428 [Phlebia brevispora]
MPVPDVIRDSLFGQIVHYASGRQLFQYPEEKPGFILPARYRPPTSRSLSEDITPSHRSSRTAIVTAKSGDSTPRKAPVSIAESEVRGADSEDTAEPPQESTLAQEYLHHPTPHEVPHDVEKAMSAILDTQPAHAAHHDPNIVDWYGPDDPEAPSNVSRPMSLH